LLVKHLLSLGVREKHSVTTVHDIISAKISFNKASSAFKSNFAPKQTGTDQLQYFPFLKIYKAPCELYRNLKCIYSIIYNDVLTFSQVQLKFYIISQ
jgi:hypothetical protein